MPDPADTARINSTLALPARRLQRFGDGLRPDMRHCVPLADIKVVEGVFFKDRLVSPDDLMVGDSYRFPARHDTGTRPDVDRAMLPAGRATSDTHLFILMSETGVLIHARVVLTGRRGPALAIFDPVQDGLDYMLIALEPLSPDLVSTDTRPARSVLACKLPQVRERRIAQPNGPAPGPS
jgi:hypothetical protein